MQFGMETCNAMKLKYEFKIEFISSKKYYILWYIQKIMSVAIEFIKICLQCIVKHNKIF